MLKYSGFHKVNIWSETYTYTYKQQMTTVRFYLFHFYHFHNKFVISSKPELMGNSVTKHHKAVKPKNSVWAVGVVEKNTKNQVLN